MPSGTPQRHDRKIRLQPLVYHTGQRLKAVGVLRHGRIAEAMP